MKYLNKINKALRVVSLLVIVLTTIGTSLVSGVTTVSAREPGAVASTGYRRGILNNFRVDAPDPDWVDGELINKILDRYPNSKLRGYGDTIKRLADKWGVNTTAYLGQIAKESTFGSVACGGDYNFGCMMWSDWMGSDVTKVGPSSGHHQYDRDWANPPTVERGIELQMQLVRESYIDKGYVYYPHYLERYSPAFENDHSSFESLMYSVANATGQDIGDTGAKIPGGLANNKELKTIALTVPKDTIVTPAQVKEEWNDSDIDSVEFMTHINTHETGSQSVDVFVKFVDNTYTKETITVSVGQKEIQIDITSLTDESESFQTLQLTGEPIKIDVTNRLTKDKTYYITNNVAEVTNYTGFEYNGLPYNFNEDNKVQLTEEDNKVYLTLPAQDDDAVYYLVDAEGQSLNSVVDSWLALNK